MGYIGYSTDVSLPSLDQLSCFGLAGISMWRGVVGQVLVKVGNNADTVFVKKKRGNIRCGISEGETRSRSGNERYLNEFALKHDNRLLLKSTIALGFFL